MRLHPASRRAFTLIELLVVIGVVAILAGILMPVIKKAFDNTDRLKARNTCLEARKAVEVYLTTYGRLPVDAGEQGEGKPDREYLDTNAKKIIATLAGIKTNTDAKKYNPRLIGFLDAPQIQDDGTLKDPWESQFGVVLDNDFDGEITFPAGSGNKYRAKAVVFSYGPNQRKDTNPTDKTYDDVSSVSTK